MEIDRTAGEGVKLADTGGAHAAIERLNEPPVLGDHRRRAWERYQSLPMPTRKSEEWRYTDLSKLGLENFTPSLPAGDATGTRAGIDELEAVPQSVRDVLARSRERGAVLVQVDGRTVYRRIDEELVKSGVVFAPLAQVAESRPELLKTHLFSSDIPAMEEKLWAAHIALLSDGYLLYVPPGVHIETPAHAFHCLTQAGIVTSSHSLVVLEAGAEATLIDEFVSEDLPEPSISLAGAELFGGDNATLAYVSLQRYGRGVRHFGLQHVTTQRESRLAGINVNLGADLARADVTSHLAGTGSESEMLALWFGDRDQHFDHHTRQHHAAPSAHSDLLYKGALTDSAESVFRGLIRVEPDAQLTDAYQTNRNLLLSDKASARALPNLEIEADDVRCSHGATVGQVEAGQLFYLMSRGLSREQAERLLVFGFFDEVLRRIPVEGVRSRIREAIERKIGL